MPLLAAIDYVTAEGTRQGILSQALVSSHVAICHAYHSELHYEKLYHQYYSQQDRLQVCLAGCNAYHSEVYLADTTGGTQQLLP